MNTEGAEGRKVKRKEGEGIKRGNRERRGIQRRGE
jgi:hypothetical protein